MKKNLDILDLVKIILAFMVVAIHTGFLTHYAYPIIRLAVPIFMILSGFLAFAKINREQQFARQQQLLFKTILRYLKLYLFWFIILLPYTLHIRQYFKNGFAHGLFLLGRDFLFGSTFRASWYLMACIIGIVLIFYLSKIVSNRALILITIPFYLFATLLSEFKGFVTNSTVLQPLYSRYVYHLGTPCFSFVIALLYIAIGKVMADSIAHPYNSKLCFYGFIACFAALFAEHRLISHLRFFSYNCDGLIFLAPTAALLVLSVLNLNIHLRHASVFRSFSTIIYCSHIPICMLLKKLFPFFTSADPLHTALFFLTGILACLFAALLLNLEKRKGLHFLQYAH